MEFLLNLHFIYAIFTPEIITHIYLCQSRQSYGTCHKYSHKMARISISNQGIRQVMKQELEHHDTDPVTYATAQYILLLQFVANAYRQVGGFTKYLQNPNCQDCTKLSHLPIVNPFPTPFCFVKQNFFQRKLQIAAIHLFCFSYKHLYGGSSIQRFSCG